MTKIDINCGLIKTIKSFVKQYKTESIKADNLVSAFSLKLEVGG